MAPTFPLAFSPSLHHHFTEARQTWRMWDQLCELNDLLIQRRRQAKTSRRAPAKPLPKLRHPYPPLVPGLVILTVILWLTLSGANSGNCEAFGFVVLVLLLFSVLEFPAAAFDLYQCQHRLFRLATLPRILWHALACTAAAIPLYVLWVLHQMGPINPT